MSFQNFASWCGTIKNVSQSEFDPSDVESQEKRDEELEKLKQIHI